MAGILVGRENSQPIELHYEDQGSGPPVVLIHGWPLGSDCWEKQILAVVAQTSGHADAIVQAFAMVDVATKADTIVAVTVTEGEDAFIYYNP